MFGRKEGRAAGLEKGSHSSSTKSKNMVSTEFWDQCPDDVLIAIFKKFDIETRIKANRTCKRWYQLLNDPRAHMEDVGSIYMSNYDRIRTKLKIWENVTTGVEILVRGLSNHVGKAKKFRLEHDDPIILTRISQAVNDGRLKIDQFSQRNLREDRTITDWMNAILPCPICELNLTIGQGHQVLVCDWPLLPELQRLTTRNILFDFSITAPSLKYLEIDFFCPILRQAEILNTTLSYLPTLEELRMSEVHFDDRSFRNFLLTIKNKLPNLRRLDFRLVGFNLQNIDTLFKEFFYEFTLDSLKEIRFNWCPGEFDLIEKIIRLFLRICSSLDSIYIYANHSDLVYIYSIAKSMTGNTNLELNINFYKMENMSALDTPSEFGSRLSKLHVSSINSRKYLREFFGRQSCEKLIEIDLENCKGLKDDILKIIAQSCLNLEKLILKDCKFLTKIGLQITENGLKSFLIYWNLRRSNRLSILINDGNNFDWNSKKWGLRIDGLFGTSFEEDQGILDERWWMMGEDENGGGTSKKRQKKSMEDHDQKRWKLYRKTVNLNEYYGRRLIIWDQGKNTVGGFDQKILVIRDYDENSSYYNSTDVRAIPI